MTTPGAQLIQLCANANSELVIAAPFMKASTLQRLLSKVPENVQVTGVTRWRVDEIASGVSDIEVWSLLRERNQAKLYLCANLHAKYYRADNDVLVGSANVTNMALGWSYTPNLELLVPMQYSDQLMAFERLLMSDVIEVDDAIHNSMVLATERFRATIQQTSAISQEPALTIEDIAVEPSPHSCWLPGTRYPEHLYTVYSGEIEQVTTATKHAALQDLTFLQVQPGLSRKAFEACVAGILLLLPIVRDLDSYVEQPRRFGEMRQWIAQKSCTGEMDKNAATNSWQVLMRWLLYFWPNRYKQETANYSEIFWRSL